MTRQALSLGAILLAVVAGSSYAIKWEAIEPVVIGGRFQYVTSRADESVPFPWNTTTQSSQDLTRLMLDLNADSRYGDLYLKGSAVWNRTRPSQIQKRFLFDQGDYLWAQTLENVDYSLRLFANERRFITYDMIAPLLLDDLVASGQDNLGVRVDTRIRRDVGITALYSSLGDRRERLRDIGYVKADYIGRPAIASLSYLLDHPGGVVKENRATFKLETAASYKQAYAILSYQQTGVSERDVFLPDGGSNSTGGGLRSSLPKGAALFAEVRLTSVRVPKAGRLKFVYDYASIGDEFFNDLGLARGAQETNRLAGFFEASTVDLNARLVYARGERFYFEDKRIDRWDAAVWGRFANGMDFRVRGHVTDTRTPEFEDEGNFINVGVEKQVNKVRSGINVMWKDIDTIFSDTRFAWDGKLALSPNWGLYWRFILSESFDVGQTLFTRLAYRPNDRIFVIFAYGRKVIGDGPFILEDQDVELSRFDTAQYTILLRGDF